MKITLPQSKRVLYLEYAREKMERATYLLALSGMQPIPLADLNIEQNEILEAMPEQTPEYGCPPLLDSLAQHYQINTENIFNALGTSNANFIAMSTLLQPGDEVIIEHPVYEPLLRIAQYNQCNIVRLQRKLDEHWAISLERLQSLLTTKTRLIAISNLHNPSGAYIPEDQIATIGKIAAEVNAFVLVDEVYLDMMPGQQLPKRAFQLGDNILSTASFTKAWGVGRARFGWIMAHPDLIRNFHLFANLDYVNPPLIAEALAIVLLRRADFLQNRMLRHIQTTLPILKQWAEQETRIRWSEPPGGLIGYVQLPASIQSDTLMQHCVQKYDMNFSPGSFFEQNNFARLAIGASPDIVTAGLERFSAALTDLI